MDGARRAPGAALGGIRAVESDPGDAYDPRTRPWYEGAASAGALFWTDVYVFWSDKQPGITAAGAPAHCMSSIRKPIFMHVRSQASRQ